MKPRAWKVELTFDRSGIPKVCVCVDGLELLPAFAIASPIEALEYVDEALVDFRRGDQITLLARRSPAQLSSWATRVRALALHWCADALQVAWYEGLPVRRGTPRVTERSGSLGISPKLALN